MPLEIVDDERAAAYARAHTGLLFDLPRPEPGAAQLPAGISLCMIVKNEERFLEACLRSARDAVDEIVVVDTGSTDRTIEIAHAYGATVVERTWRNDFAWARNEALALATRRWTLVLDADEELAPESIAPLRALRETPAGLTAVYVQIRNVVDDASGAGSTMTHVLPRIFPTTPRLRYRNVVHESVVLDGEHYVNSVVSPILVLHKGYTAAMLEGRGKTARNRPLLERAVREAADDAFSWFNFGISAVVAGDWDAGIDALERMFALPGPVRAFFPIASVMLATAYAEGRGEIERGIQVLDDGLAVSPGHPNIAFTRGYLLALLERYDEARSWYERAAETRFDAGRHSMVDDEIALWKAALNIATTFVKERRFAEALPWFERALASKPDSSLLRGLTAAAYERVGRVYEAERLFRDGAERDGDAGFVAYVNYLMRRRRFAEAFEQVERRRDAVDDAAYGALLLSAAIAMRDEQLGDPEPFALRALELGPGDGRALAFLDAQYAESGECEKRARLRDEELAAPLRGAADYARRSHRLLEDQRLEEALAAAVGGLEREPQDGVLRYNAALAAARLGWDAVALEHLADVGPDDRHATVALALRAEIERRAGDLDAALATLRRATALPHRDTEVLRAAGVGLAAAFLEAGRLDDAGRAAEAALV